jgi:tetratricopeptide (TPR) repeat protein
MSGEAAVAVGAADQGMVSGELVNAASRLQGLAPTGGVLVDEATRRAAGEAIAFEDAGEHEARGLPEPIHAWRPLHVVSMRRGARRSTQLEPPFVGRDAELRLLKELLHATAAERRARLVSVTGLAGIGKTRLAWELEKYIDGIVDDIWWHQGRSPAYGDGITFWALAEMVRARAGIAETDPAEVARERLTAMLDEYVDDAVELRRIAPAFGVLLGLEEASGDGTEQLFASWRVLFERIARRGPVVLVFEDLQWADAGLIDFVESILEWSRNHPILVLTLARPELLERRPTWGAGQRNFTALHLEPLGADAMRALLAGLVPGLPRSLERRIAERAAGIPLFAVETVRMLMDDGRLVVDDGRVRVAGDLDRLTVPDTLRALIGARLDALEPADRALLQDASVLGQSFPIEGLEAISGVTSDRLAPRLRTLVRRELLEELTDPGSPERGQYAFVQAVIREVAYETLSKRDRRARHLDAARYFEALGGEELAGILASHYHDAYLATPDGPEADALSAQARVALRSAADRATSLGSYDQALAYLEKALTVTVEPAERAALWEAASEAALRAARFDIAETRSRQALDWYRTMGRRPDLARAATLLARPLHQAGRTDDASVVLETALAECEGLESDPAVVGLLAELARARMVVDDPRALELADRALSAAEPLELIPIVAEALVTRAAALDTAGRGLEATALTRGVIELAKTHGLRSTELRARSNLVSAMVTDSPLAAHEAGLETRELARRLGDREGFLWVTGLATWSAGLLGRFDWILAALEELEGTDLPPGSQEDLLATQALVAAYRGETDRAMTLLAAAEAIAPDVSRPAFLAARHSTRAEILALAGRLDEAFDEAMAAAGLDRYVFFAAIALQIALWMADLGRARTALPLVLETSERGRYVAATRRALEAGVLALDGRRGEAVPLYRQAIADLRDLDVPLQLGLRLMEFATLVGPDDPAAGAAAGEAREIFTRLGSPSLLTRLDEGLVRRTTGRRPAGTRGTTVTAPAPG